MVVEMDSPLYFAYGSNINLDQMAVRCPDAQVVGPATLENYELLFRGNARGTGVATIAPCWGKTVCGLLWRITPQCELSLDMYEGFPKLYGKQSVAVQTPDGQNHWVMTYIMTHEWLREPAVPSEQYADTIREGYRQNGLPVRKLNQALKCAHSEVREWQSVFSDDWPILHLANQSQRKRGSHPHER